MKIAVIGNGKLSKKYGKSIDKCDSVVRFNKAEINNYEEYVGKKTSILALVNETALSYQAAIGHINNDIIKECEYIYLSGRKRNLDYERLLLQKKERMTKSESSIVFVYIDQSCFIEVCTTIEPGFVMEKVPTTGINILCYILLSMNILDTKEHKLNIYGFDCFKSGHYFDDENRDNDTTHNLDMEKNILDYLKSYNNIKIYN